MHELSIAVSIVERIEDEAEKRGVEKVEAVHLKLGALSGVDRDALAFSYEVACEGTPLEGSRLVIEAVGVVMYCAGCCREHSPKSERELCCPRCFTPSQEVIHGRELEVTAFEIVA